MKKLLLIIKYSKYRTTGFYYMNNSIINSILINNEFNTKYIILNAPKKNNLIYWFVNSIILIFSNVYKIIREILMFNPEMVYMTISPVNAFYRDLIFVSILKIFKCNIIFHLHGRGVKEKCKNRFWKYVYKLVYKNVQVICLSEALTDDISEIYFNKPFIVFNGINNYIDKNQLVLKSQNFPIKIIYLSNFIRSKGIFEFIDALFLLSKFKNIPFEGIIVGNEDEIKKDELESYLNLKNLKQNIIIKGPKYGMEKYSELLNSDIFVFPTYFEAFGLVILEAMQCGLPIISTNEGSIPEIIENEKTGYLVPKHDIYQLFKIIKFLALNSDIRNQLGKAAREKFLKHYTTSSFEKQICEVFHRIYN